MGVDCQISGILEGGMSVVGALWAGVGRGERGEGCDVAFSASVMEGEKGVGGLSRIEGWERVGGCWKGLGNVFVSLGVWVAS